MGVLAVYGVKDASTLLYYGLHNLQHRGQEGGGIATFDENGKSYRFRGLGLLNEIFNDVELKKLKGSLGIGSVKYANASREGLDNVQPVFFHHRSGDFAVAGDGNVVNSKQIREYLEKHGTIFQTDTDSEILAHLIKKSSNEYRIDNIMKALNMMEGGFTFVIMTKNRIYACRDKYGIKPLCLGKLGDGYVISSESCAFEIMGATFIRDVRPGEIVCLDRKGVRSTIYSHFSIGGKDSMSGTFESIHVPPTLVAFGITTVDARTVISPEFKEAGHSIYLLRHKPLDNRMPDTDALAANWTFLREQILAGNVVSAWSLGYGGIAEALVKMSMGNTLGVDVVVPEKELFSLGYGSVVVETVGALESPAAVLLGGVTASGFRINGESLSTEALEKAYEGRYYKLYPPKVRPAFDEPAPEVEEVPFDPSNLVYPGAPVDKPVVCLPVFPGTNCDYDTAKAFRKAGAEVRPFVFRNLTPEDVLNSIDGLAERIGESHILAFCGEI